MGKPDKPAPAEEPKRDEVAELIRGNLEQLAARRKAKKDAEAGLRAEGEKEVAAAGKALKKAERLGKTALDKFGGGWKDAQEVSDPSFQAGEKRILTGNIVNFRKAEAEDSGVMARLSRGAEFTVAVDPEKSGQPKILEKGGERFVLVKDKKDRVGYVAAVYLKPFPERVAAVKERKGRIEITDEKMFRELVVYKLEKKFPGDENTAKRDALYAKWDQGYQLIMRTRRDQSSRDEALQRLYATMDLGEKGVAADLYADKVKMELEFALGARRAGAEVEVPAGIENPEDALNDALSRLGYEIGIYYGKQGRMSVVQIREAFNIKGVADSRGNEWGEPGSRAVFNYMDGKLYFYPPKEKAVQEQVPLHEARFAAVPTREGSEIVRLEGQRFTTREKPIGIRHPQDSAMAQLAAERSREYMAAVIRKKETDAGV